MKVAIIGGGAAGYFSAFSVKKHHPNAEVILYEKTSKSLSKVKVSGGGRCNVTHHCFDIAQLVKHYPRGSRFLKKAFHFFGPTDTIEWFKSRGVSLKIEEDNRMFPTTDSSQTIIDCFNEEVEKLGIQVKFRSTIHALVPLKDSIKLDFGEGNVKEFNKVIVATGGSPKLEGLKWLQALGHRVEPPVPSLFTFNMPTEKIKELMGLVAPNASVKVQGSKLIATGPVLITHWGMSGPGILKLSSFGARDLAQLNYNFKIQINWVNATNEDQFRMKFAELLSSHPKAGIQQTKIDGVPKRLWHFILKDLGIDLAKPSAELSKKDKNRLINALLNAEYQVSGKTTFKEEFVTCGGVSLSDINPKTMESRVVPNLYFAGEVMDIDGVTGGFNFQAAWTTGYIAGKLDE